MKRLVLILLLSSPVYACMNDYECGYNATCVIPKGSNSLHGMCMARSDPTDYTYKDPTKVHRVRSCNFDTDCKMGSQCIKQMGQLVGVCVR